MKKTMLLVTFVMTSNVLAAEVEEFCGTPILEIQGTRSERGLSEGGGVYVKNSLLATLTIDGKNARTGAESDILVAQTALTEGKQLCYRKTKAIPALLELYIKR